VKLTEEGFLQVNKKNDGWFRSRRRDSGKLDTEVAEGFGKARENGQKSTTKGTSGHL